MTITDGNSARVYNYLYSYLLLVATAGMLVAIIEATLAIYIVLL